MINKDIAARFQAVFGKDLADYWDDADGFNLVKFDTDVVGPGKHAHTVLERKYGKAGVELAVELITTDMENLSI